MIFAMLTEQRWDPERVACHLGVTRNTYLDFDDQIQAMAATLYLPTGFKVHIKVHAGKGVGLEEEKIPNHMGEFSRQRTSQA
jgi:hypothetical protein